MNTAKIHSDLELAKLTRNEKYLPQRYKLVLASIRKGLTTTREVAEHDPLKKKSHYKLFKTLMNFYGKYMRALAKMGFVDREIDTSDLVTVIGRRFIYKPNNLKIRKITLRKNEFLKL